MIDEMSLIELEQMRGIALTQSKLRDGKVGEFFSNLLKVIGRAMSQM